MSGRDNFTIEMPHATLTAIPNGSSATLKSPSDLKSHRTASFSREGMLGNAQKARHPSQSIGDGLPNGIKDQSDEGSNPLKRRNTDVGVDYPRRRATIAVCYRARNCASASWLCAAANTDFCNSVRFADRENHDVMETSPSASSAQSWVLSASTGSRASSSTQAISSFSSA